LGPSSGCKGNPNAELAVSAILLANTLSDFARSFGQWLHRIPSYHMVNRAVVVGGAAAIAFGAVLARSRYDHQQHDADNLLPWADPLATPAPRSAQIKSLRHGHFDVLVVGGGATGCGVALDAATRGMKVAVVEQADFAAGTSSRSTKLVHGGVRYLEKAFFQMDYGQLKLVFEALHERRVMLENARHVCNLLPTLTPCYRLWEVPYYWSGMKLYDLVAYASGSGLGLSRFAPVHEAKRLFPTLALTRPDNVSLKGTVVYYDGQFDDARMCISLALSAAMAGASVANYTQVTSLRKDDTGKVIGVRVKDLQTNQEFNVDAKVVVNATGIHSDSIRKMSHPDRPQMITPSSGVHLTLPDFYSPDSTALIVPKTKDGRVVFMLPWLGSTIAGTTDSKAEVTMRPRASTAEVDFILDALSDYLTVQVRPEDVLSVWSGIRPLALDPTQDSTENVSRDHVVVVEPDNMITITGGKWTTYRKMAQDAVDAAVKMTGMDVGPCKTTHMPVAGAVHWKPDLFTEVAQNYTVPHRPGFIDTRVAQHLARSYGDRARHVTRIAEEQKLGKRLVRGHPMLEAEVVYCVQHEFCLTPMDFLAHRTRLAFLDHAAAVEALPRVVQIMSKTLGWGPWRRRQETIKAKEFLKTFTCVDEEVA